MAYSKTDWTTWTKAAMIRTIEALTDRQTSLLNRIAELERKPFPPTVVPTCQTCACEARKAYIEDVHVLLAEQGPAEANPYLNGTLPEPDPFVQLRAYGSLTEIDWSKVDK